MVYIETKDYWNRVADKKVFSTPFQIEIFSKYADKNMKILDVGCGYGRTLKELYDNGYRNLIGIDFSSKMIERANSSYPDISFKISEGKKLDFEDNSIDCVILLAVLTCITNEDDQYHLISEIHRILKKGGVLYINDFLINDNDMYINRYEKYKDKYSKYGIFETEDGGVFRHHSEEYLDKLLSKFNCLEKEKLKYKTMNGHISNGLYYIGRK